MTSTISVIYQDIATLTGLQFDAQVPIRHDSNLKREIVKILANAGLCTNQNVLGQLDLRYSEQEPVFPMESSIVDTLGEYYPAQGEIVIYDAMCHLAAAALNADVEVLKQVVEAHEIAHAVTHLGMDDEGQIWEHFAVAASEDKELFAQIYPLLLGVTQLRANRL